MVGKKKKVSNTNLQQQQQQQKKENRRDAGTRGRRKRPFFFFFYCALCVRVYMYECVFFFFYLFVCIQTTARIKTETLMRTGDREEAQPDAEDKPLSALRGRGEKRNNNKAVCFK